MAILKSILDKGDVLLDDSLRDSLDLFSSGSDSRPVGVNVQLWPNSVMVLQPHISLNMLIISLFTPTGILEGVVSRVVWGVEFLRDM